MKAQHVAVESSKINQPVNYTLNFFDAITSGLIIVTIDGQLSQITFKLNKDMLKATAKTNNVLVVDVQNSFTS